MKAPDRSTIEYKIKAQRSDTLAAQGICTHGWLQTQDHGICTCKDCGKVFASMDAAMDAHSEMVS